MKTSLFAILIIAIYSPSYLLSAAEKKISSPLIINTEHYPPISTKDEDGFEDLIAKEMFKRAGVDIVLNYLSSERVLVNVNQGIDDGLLSRVGGMARVYPNLLQFEESVIKADYIAFSRRKDIRIDGWDSLKPFHVGIINGWKLLERNISGTQSLIKVKNSKQLFAVLDKGRVDLIIFSRYSGLQIVKDLGLIGIRVLEPPLATRDRYFYLNKKHKSLAVRASAALREMKADGTYNQIFDKVIKPILID